METKSKEMEIAKELVLKIFRFLEKDYLYTPQFEIKGSAVFLEYASIEYINKSKKRSIDISYTKGEVYGEIKYTFSLGVVRTPYIASGDMISLSNYLDSKNQNFNTSITAKFNSQEAENILKEMARVLRSELSNVIDGSVWYETYYPRKD